MAVLDLLERHRNWDFVCLQEIGFAGEPDISEDLGRHIAATTGHRMVVNRARSYDTVVVVHRRHKHRPVDDRHGGTAMEVQGRRCLHRWRLELGTRRWTGRPSS